MSLHLAEIALAVAPGAHAVVLLDQAGWHISRKLEVPANITLLPLPAKGARAEPGREHLAVSCAKTGSPTGCSPPTTDILDHCCEAWNRLDRSTLDHHVHRPSRMGSPVLISGIIKSSAAR